MIKLLSLACILGLTSVIAPAAVIFSTDGTATPGFFPANGTTSTPSVFHAYQFTVAAGQGGVLDQVAVAGLASAVFTETIYIRSDASGSRGSILDTILLTTIGDSTGHLYTGTSTTHVTLAAGTKYWLEVASPLTSNSFLWLQASPVVSSRVYSSTTGYFDNIPMSAFALLTAPEPPGVPEPGSWVLSLSGLTLLALRFRHRSRRSA